MINDVFFEKPYMSRQLVLFVDDAAIVANDQITTIEKNTEKKGSSRDSYGFIELGIDILKTLLAPPILAEIMVETLKSYWEAKNKGVENLKLVGKSKIPFFRLPPGHPRDQTVYAGHPAIPNVYVPLADFHRLTFEHKFSEIISLLMHLGAKTVKVEHITGWSTEFSSHLAVTLPVTASQAEPGIEVGSKQDDKQTLLYHAVLENKHVPYLPTDLVWYPYESTWQQIAEGRLKFGLKNFLLYLSYKDDFGINGGLKIKVEKAGLDLGGTFERHTATTWRISGEFQE